MSIFRKTSHNDDPGLGNRSFSGRMILPNGRFRVRRTGLAWWLRHSPYQMLMSLPGWAFLAIALGTYLAANSLYAFLYLWIGPGHLAGISPERTWGTFLSCFFFSAQTLTTVGYGHISPEGFMASALSSMEALSGLGGFAVWTGLLFARLSRPRSRILFARDSVIAPFQDGAAWMFRMVPAHDHPLLEAEVWATFSWAQDEPTGRVRRYRDLHFDRSSVKFFPMNWTLVHPIDAESPMSGLSAKDLEEGGVEMMVLVRAHDETYGQTVHARSSWRAEEILRGRRYANMMENAPDGGVVLDLTRLGETTPAYSTSVDSEPDPDPPPPQLVQSQ
jgi:inward rectifier potassium channel